MTRAGTRSNDAAAQAASSFSAPALMLAALLVVPVAGALAAECGAPATPIAAIQGNAARSPQLGAEVEVEAVVVGNFQRGLRGYFIEAPAAEQDRDVATSEGLYVLSDAPLDAVRSGRRVRVLGRVLEYEHVPGLGGSVTALQPAAPPLDCGDGGWIAPVALHQPPPDWERHEGMRVALRTPLTVISNAALLKYGELEVALGGRLYQPTELARPGNPARAAARTNLRARLTLDDNRRTEFPRAVWYLDAPLSAERPWRSGTTLAGVEGVLDEQRGYRLQLTAAPIGVRQAPRPPPPARPTAALRVASFNVLNLFNGDGRGGGFPTLRGAPDRAAYERQRAKLVAAIVALEPDIAALMELENDGYGPDGSLAQLVRALNKALGGAGDYQLVNAGTPRLGSDDIAVGLIYRAQRVQRVGRPARLIDGAFARDNRVPLAQAFAHGAQRLVVVANHFKSKGGCAEAAGKDADQNDGQACWNATRTRAARELAAWLARDPTGAGRERVLVLGDLNAHTREDPVRTLLAAGYVDLGQARVVPGGTGSAPAPAYSFVYDGLAGRLDHALATPALAADVLAVREWHINADEAEAFDYRRTGPAALAARAIRADPYRSSDHDPLVIDLRGD